MALMPLRSRSRVKASMVLTRADTLCIHNYMRSLLNIGLICYSQACNLVRVQLPKFPTL